MNVPEGDSDEPAIRALIGAHFQGLTWTPTTHADWFAFSADFLPGASFYPAARPVPGTEWPLLLVADVRRSGRD
jgi:hypothetical protein